MICRLLRALHPDIRSERMCCTELKIHFQLLQPASLKLSINQKVLSKNIAAGGD